MLLKHALGSPEKLKACQGQYETIERLRSLSPKIMQEAFLVQEVRPTPSPQHPDGGRMWGPFGGEPGNPLPLSGSRCCQTPVLSSPRWWGQTSSRCE